MKECTLLTGVPRVALVLPPTQSFFMPYSAPAVLSAALQERRRIEIVTIDAGIDWLFDESQRRDAGGGFGALDGLRRPESYGDAFALHREYCAAERVFASICAPWLPERVNLDGRYYPPRVFQTWDDAAAAAADLTLPRLFDRYYVETLLPSLREFAPDVVGLSIPFDWMLFPALRLAHWMSACHTASHVIIGGHAINRLWNERASELFHAFPADWAGVTDGESALGSLLDLVADGALPPDDGPLVRLPTSSTGRAMTAHDNTYSGRTVPDFSQFPLSRYLRPEPILPVPASDGCFFGRCRFCSRQRSDQSVAYVERSPREVATVMRSLANRYGSRHFILAEDIVSHKFMVRLSEQLANEGLDWFCEASFKAGMVSRLSTADCVTLRAGGCRLILNGLESASAKVRDAMHCPVDLKAYDRNLDQLVAAGIVPYITMIFGYPGESRHDLQESIAYIRRHLHHAVFSTSHFWIVPGTPLSRELAARSSALIQREGVLAGGLSFADSDTVSTDEASELVRRALPGWSSTYTQFTRSIPVLMQLISKPTGISANAALMQAI
jgi:radical SAM superfamily enzyme YgiQ (UPF0313 family)